MGLRDYQKRIVDQVLEAYATGRPSVLIESATGSGKTFMGLAAIAEIQKATGCSVGWAAMRRNLLTQTDRENVDKGFNAKIQYISMYDKNPPQVDILVVDEAHHDSCRSMTTIHSVIKPKFVIGLTATPFRSDRVGLVFSKTIRDAGIRELIRDGWLSRFNHICLPAYNPTSVVEFFLPRRLELGKTVMFFPRITDCEEAASELLAAGVKCEVVTGTTDREDQIRRFSEGSLQVLLNVQVLTEGFDCPSIKTVFCKPTGKGLTCQMAGRALRLHEGEVKNIIQCKNTRYSFTQEATAENRYTLVNGELKSLNPSPLLEVAVKNAIVAASSVKLTKRDQAALNFCKNYKRRRTFKQGGLHLNIE